MRKTVNGKRARTGTFFVFRFQCVRPLPSNIYAESGISILYQLPGTFHYNGTGNSAHYRLAYADFRSGAWTVAPCGGEDTCACVILRLSTKSTTYPISSYLHRYGGLVSNWPGTLNTTGRETPQFFY